MTKLAACAAVLVAAVSLSACVNVLPKTKPVQLYRFSFAPQAPDKQTITTQATAPLGPYIAVNMGQIDFPQAAAGDRVLTTEGNEISYVGGSRWAIPVRQMFSEAVSEGFARTATTIRLDPRGPATAAYRLDMTVHHYESVYKRGKPTVSIALDARVIRLSDRIVVGQRYITADVPVKHNDMSLMADAYDEATTEVVTDLVNFTQDTVAANPLPDAKVALPK